MDARLLYAKIIELPKRVVNYNKKISVIFNGEENEYPERVNRLIEHSITAKQCRKLYRQFVTGMGFGETLNNIKVNKEDETTLFQFLSAFNSEFAEQYGVPVHIMYNISGEPVSYKVLPYMNVRKGKKDSDNYSGKYAYCEDWSNAKKTNVTWFDAFNPRPSVIQKQIEKAGDINKYTGQVFFFNPSNSDYPLAQIHPVLNDTDSEFRTSLFKNKSLRKGFFGKKVLVTPPRISKHLTTITPSQMSNEELANLRHQEAARDEIEEALQGFVGVENNEGFMILEADFQGDDIKKAIEVIDIDTNINDKLFAHTEESVSNNIRKAFNNVPKILIDSSESGLFGKSGEAFKQAKLFYQEQLEEERMLIEQAFKKMFQNFKGFDSNTLKIEKLIANGTD